MILGNTAVVIQNMLCETPKSLYAVDMVPCFSDQQGWLIDTNKRYAASQIVAIENGKQDPVIAVGNLDIKRDFTDVRDVVRAYRLLIGEGDLGSVYNVASGNAVSIRDVLDMLLSFSTCDITVKTDPGLLRPRDVPVLCGDASLIRSAVGWEPEISLEQSLRDVVGWWREVRCAWITFVE